MRFALFSAGLLLALPGDSLAQSAKEDVPVTRLTITPAKAPVPALKYHLLPRLSEMRTGNAALLYQRAHSPEWFSSLWRDKASEKIYELLELPLSKLPRDTWFGPNSMLQEIDLAARRTHCDWEFLDRIREDGFLLLIPDVQSFRTYGQLLSLRTRVRLVEKKYDEAIHSLQTHFALSRHVADAPILINVLVGAALANIALHDVEQMTQLEGAPNLFWALADLPRPLISTRKALEGERIMLDVVVPGIREALKDPKRPPMTVAQISKGLAQLSLFEKEPFTDRLAMTFLATRSYPKARQYLLENGFDEEQVEALPVLQVALMYGVVEYDRLYDEMVKWANQPPWQARAGFKKSFNELATARLNLDMSLLATMVIPAMQKVREAQNRLERKLAMLQTVEAIRLYAAAHGGQLPEALTDIKGLPLPLDPETGQAFEYSVSDGKAMLVGPAPAGQPANILNSMRYELTPASKSK